MSSSYFEEKCSEEEDFKTEIMQVIENNDFLTRNQQIGVLRSVTFEIEEANKR